MGRSISQKRADFADLVGPAGKPDAQTNRHGVLMYRVSCRFCQDRKGNAWSSVKYLSPIHDGPIKTLSVALARWANHLEDRHPEVTDAPCLTAPFLAEARSRERERDAERRAAFDVA